MFIGRQQVMDGQQSILIALGCLTPPGLLERALAHGASCIASDNRVEVPGSRRCRLFCHGKWGPSRAATNWRHDGDESSTVRRVGDRVVDDIDKAQEMNGG